MKKYWGDTVCSECGKEIPYGVKRWCPKCNALEKIDEGKLEEFLQKQCVMIDRTMQQELGGYIKKYSAKKLAKALIQRKDDWLL